MKPFDPSRGASLTATYGPLAPYAVELLLESRAPLDGEAIAARLRDFAGAIEVRSLPGGGFTLAYFDHATTFAEGTRPMVHLVTYVDELGDVAGRAAALQQTWDWDGARAAVDRARAVLLVQDSPGLQRVGRLDLFQRLVRALAAALPVKAIHWMPSQRIVEPRAYLAPNPPDPVTRGPVNVRTFKVGGGAPGEVLMDTMGLAAFLLPDLQCRMTGVDPSKVALHLAFYAQYLFTNGDVLKHRDTIDGVGERWRCHRGEAARVPPAREVIELRRDEARATALVDAPATAAARCPDCGWVPTALARWECDCGFMWNTFDTRGQCPACARAHVVTACLACGGRAAHEDWYLGT